MDKVWISLYSAHSWSEERIWRRFLEQTQRSTGLLPHRLGQFEPLKPVVPSIEEIAKRIAFAPSHCVQHWILNYGNGIYGIVSYYPSPTEHHGFLYNEITITIPISHFKSAMKDVSIKVWFRDLAECFYAFYGDVELESTINQESQILQRRWNLAYEFPTLGWLTYFSNRVVSFFGLRKVQKLSRYVEHTKDGILITMGDTPEEAGARREEKFRLERILGANSFVVPAALPKVDESMIDTVMLEETDPFYHLPKMPNGERKPKYVYVPSFDALAYEFQT